MKTKWKNLRVGDVIKINNNEFIPSDLIAISSSDPKGTFFIETKNLDGETNLKNKKVQNDLRYLNSISLPEVMNLLLFFKF